jgi:hypothetical protein
MIRYQIVRDMAATEKWVCCGDREGYLMESTILPKPANALTQNLLKLEVAISDPCLNQTSLTYKLHLTIRLTKIMYVDTLNFHKIGEQQFFVLPSFERAVLSDIYEQRPKSA